jgi:tetratricopeptide (TPR) repeat protein
LKIAEELLRGNRVDRIVLAEEALRKALSFTSPDSICCGEGKGARNERVQVVQKYVEFLKSQNRLDEAFQLLRKEMTLAPSSPSSANAERMLMAGFRKYIRADDEVFWSWLEHSGQKWGFGVEHELLLVLWEKSEQNDPLEFVRKAEALANGKDPTRALVIGTILRDAGFAERSIPLLSSAAAKFAIQYKANPYASHYYIGRSLRSLFHSYLKTGDWKTAEQKFAQMAQYQQPADIPYDYSAIAVCAAQKGAKQDAIRIWEKATNISPIEIRMLHDLVNAGLKNELIEYYVEMQKKMPSSEAPARALNILNSH